MPEAISLILVRLPNWIGDAVVSLSALQGIQTRYPDIEINLTGLSTITQLISEYACFPVYSPESSDHKRFDAGLCFPLSFRSAFDLWRIPCKVRTGFGHEGRSLFFNRRLDYGRWSARHLHQVTYYQEIVSSLFPGLSYSAPSLLVPNDRRNEVISRWVGELEPGTLLMAVNPGAFFGNAKTWPSSYFILLLTWLLSDFPSLRILLFSGGKDRDKADILEKELPRERVFPLQGKTSLSESLAILSGCHYLLTNDSGMMHMGAAMGIPGTVFFGPTDPVATGPLGGKIRILKHHVTCAPCLLRECPIDHRCMTGLTPETVHGPIFEDLRRIVDHGLAMGPEHWLRHPSEKAEHPE